MDEVIDVPVVLFDNTPPTGRTYADHLKGGPDESQRGLPHFLLDLADASKGFRCLVLHPTAAALLDFALNLGLEGVKRRGCPVGTWRGYPIFIDPDLPEVGGYLAEHFDGRQFGILRIVNV